MELRPCEVHRLVWDRWVHGPHDANYLKPPLASLDVLPQRLHLVVFILWVVKQLHKRASLKNLSHHGCQQLAGE